MGRNGEYELLLDQYRALDLTDEKGYLCGKILGDLGADVIKVERPGGDHARNIGPFYHDVPHPEKSLFWYAYNNNKRGITLNTETHDGQDIFDGHELVAHSVSLQLRNVGFGVPLAREGINRCVSAAFYLRGFVCHEPIHDRGRIVRPVIISGCSPVPQCRWRHFTYHIRRGPLRQL